jgi:hypothetical protein
VTRLRLAAWRADRAGAAERALAGLLDVRPVPAEAARPEADLDLYALDAEPPSELVYARALEQPGVVLLRGGSLHPLRRRLARDAEGRARYVREMRRSHGEAGAFVARLVLRGDAGNLWPRLHPALGELAAASLAFVCERASEARELQALGFTRPVLLLPRPWSGTAPPDTAAEPLVVREGEDGPGLDALLGALAAGRIVVVPAGLPEAEDLPDGAVVRFDPNAGASLPALVQHLDADPALRAAVSRAAREHVRDHHAPEGWAARLAAFLQDVAADATALRASVAAGQAEEGGLKARLHDELRASVHGLGLSGVAPSLFGRLAPLV